MSAEIQYLTYVGAQGDGEHDLEGDDVEASEGGKDGGRDRGGLHEDGDAAAEDHGDVSVEVGGLAENALTARSEATS